MPTPIRDDNRALVLASASPRRRLLLERIGFRPVVRPAEVPENPSANESARDYTRRLSEQKADVASANLGPEFEDSWVIAADTVVVFENEILEKPRTRADARRMVARLSGTEHSVVTSYCIRSRDGSIRTVQTDTTAVSFRKLDESLIERYVANGRPMDKAGAYGIQDLGGVFVDSIRGSFFTVVGLPIADVIAQLRQLGALEQFPFTDRTDE